MKKNVPRAALALLIIGLMLVGITSLIGQAYQLPDFDKGIFMGFGIGLELVAVFAIIRHKKRLTDR
jgi:hypothetical protein